MKHIIIYIVFLITACSFAQEKDALLAIKKSNNYVYEGNTLVENDDFVSAEMAYRKALSERPETVEGKYNLGNSYYKKGNYEEALFRLQQAAKSANSKEEKHKAFHNIGNALMQGNQFKEAVEAYKNALRNDPTDDETRHNLAVAKKKAKEQEDKQDQNQDNKDDKDQKDENKDDKEKKEDKENQDKKEGDDKEDKKDEGDKEDKKEGEDEKKEDGKPKDEKKDQGKGDQEKKEQPKPQPQPGQLSPQQIKSLLEAMNNQEQKVQEKMNEEKQKGIIIKTEKDW